jgi:predicted ester cyclase
MKRMLALSAVVCLIAAGCTNSTGDTANRDSTRMSGADAGTSTAENMEEKNRATALASVQGFITHDANTILKDIAPDFVDYGDGSMPPIKGKDSSLAMINAMLVAFPDVNGENIMALADGNHVAVFGDWSGTFKGKLMNMAPTGKPFKIKDVDLFTFNNSGQITEHRSVQSVQAMMMQVMPDKKK